MRIALPLTLCIVHYPPHTLLHQDRGGCAGFLGVLDGGLGPNETTVPGCAVGVSGNFRGSVAPLTSAAGSSGIRQISAAMMHLFSQLASTRERPPIAQLVYQFPPSVYLCLRVNGIEVVGVGVHPHLHPSILPSLRAQRAALHPHPYGALAHTE
jgi:hypothetical protein